VLPPWRAVTSGAGVGLIKLSKLSSLMGPVVLVVLSLLLGARICSKGRWQQQEKDRSIARVVVLVQYVRAG
jgi:hypothetical protein